MKTIRTSAIVLGRTDYGEADRILTLLTPDQGKLRVMARGVRKVKSKLAGGIELFSVSDITFIAGRGEIGTLVSARLATHYGAIVNDLDRLNLGYEVIKTLNKATEDEPEKDYFELLVHTFEALADAAVPLPTIQLWFGCQLLRLSGHAPNLASDTTGQRLRAETTYTFDYDHVAFAPKSNGSYQAAHIKALRLLCGEHDPQKLAQVSGLAEQTNAIASLVRTLQSTYIRAAS